MEIRIPSKNIFIADSSNLGEFYMKYVEGYDHCTHNVNDEVLDFLAERFNYDYDKVYKYLEEKGNLPTTVEYIKNNPEKFLEWCDDLYGVFVPINSDKAEIITLGDGYVIRPVVELKNNEVNSYELLGHLSIDGANIIFLDSQMVNQESIDYIKENKPDSSHNDLFSLLDNKAIYDWKYDGLIKVYNVYNLEEELIEVVLFYCEYKDGHYNHDSNEEIEKYYINLNR